MSTVGYRGITCSASRNVERKNAIFAPICHPVCFSRFISSQILFPILVKNTIFHFQNYMEQTTEQHRPFLQEKSTSSSHGIPFNPTSQHASNTCRCIECTECGKRWVIYAARNMKYDEMERLKRIIDGVQYSCGSVLRDIDCSSRDHQLIDKVYMRANLTCAKWRYPTTHVVCMTRSAFTVG